MSHQFKKIRFSILTSFLCLLFCTSAFAAGPRVTANEDNHTPAQAQAAWEGFKKDILCLKNPDGTWAHPNAAIKLAFNTCPSSSCTSQAANNFATNASNAGYAAFAGNGFSSSGHANAWSEIENAIDQSDLSDEEKDEAKEHFIDSGANGKIDGKDSVVSGSSITFTPPYSKNSVRAKLCAKYPAFRRDGDGDNGGKKDDTEDKEDSSDSEAGSSDRGSTCPPDGPCPAEDEGPLFPLDPPPGFPKDVNPDDTDYGDPPTGDGKTSGEVESGSGDSPVAPQPTPEPSPTPKSKKGDDLGPVGALAERISRLFGNVERENSQVDGGVPHTDDSDKSIMPIELGDLLIGIDGLAELRGIDNTIYLEPLDALALLIGADDPDYEVSFYAEGTTDDPVLSLPIHTFYNESSETGFKVDDFTIYRVDDQGHIFGEYNFGEGQTPTNKLEFAEFVLRDLGINPEEFDTSASVEEQMEEHFAYVKDNSDIFVD